jgi:hypothetical protein
METQLKSVSEKGNVLVQGLKHSGRGGSQGSNVPLHLLTAVSLRLALFSDSTPNVVEMDTMPAARK